MEHINDWFRWHVELNDGTQCDVWADGYQELEGFYVFGALVSHAGEVSDAMLITGRTPSDETRFIIATARFPREAVASIVTAP